MPVPETPTLSSPPPPRSSPSPSGSRPATVPWVGRRMLAQVDRFFDRVYGSRFNPLYQSGTIVVLLLVVLVVTGLYLLLYYRIGAPYASVERIQDQVWAGRWVRALHRYASDLAVVAIAVHAVRMFLRGRSWGARALAWITGLGLVALFFFIAMTGFVMVWDVQGQLLAMEGARLLDALPVFSEPVSRAFSGERPMPGAFFFLNYFLHIALPLGMALFLYLHVARVARPKLLPPRPLGWAVVSVLLLLSLVWPVPLPPPADLGTMLHGVPLDWFFGFWLPVSRALPAGWAWMAGLAVAAVLLSVPLWTRPRRKEDVSPSKVVGEHCTGCEQCFLDCPYDAITMIPRPPPAARDADGRRADPRTGQGRRAALSDVVARVDPELCVSCGICAGSCAPMLVGPSGRSGRDQLGSVRAFLADRRLGPTDVILIACSRGAGEVGGLETFRGATVYPADCIGTVHSSVVEFLLRGGAGGVMLAGCPERDCWNREGTRWARERLFHGREAELQERVDRRRIRFVEAGAAERGRLAAEIDAFRGRLSALEKPAPASSGEVVSDAECEKARTLGAGVDG